MFCPFGGQVEAFGIVLTEAMTHDHATNLVVKLQACPDITAATDASITMTLPGAAGDVTAADIHASDTSSPTTTQACAVGARFISTSTSMPLRIPAGGRFYVEVTTAAGAAGGAFYAFAQFRHNGPPSPAAAADSPVTEVAS